MKRVWGAGVITAAMLVPAGTAAAATTKIVYAGPPPAIKKVAAKVIRMAFVKKYNPEIDAFFRSRVTIHVGDSIKFLRDGFHTIDIPKPGTGDLPFALPGPTVTGVNDAAGNPFWFDNRAPNIGLNPALFAPSGGSTYDGSGRIESGLFTGKGLPKPFTVKFTKAGVFKFFCDIHPGMVGYVVVKGKGRHVPSAAQDATALAALMAGDVLSAKQLATRKVGKHRVSVGIADRHGVELFQMFPSTLRIKPGTTVTFSMSRHSREAHTVTFGPKAVLLALAKEFQGGRYFPPQVAYPSDLSKPILASPTTHGNGFFGSGILDADKASPLPSSAKITFTKKGVYHFICMIHPFMHGTIIVR